MKHREHRDPETESIGNTEIRNQRAFRKHRASGTWSSGNKEHGKYRALKASSLGNILGFGKLYRQSTSTFSALHTVHCMPSHHSHTVLQVMQTELHSVSLPTACFLTCSYVTGNADRTNFSFPCLLSVS